MRGNRGSQKSETSAFVGQIQSDLPNIVAQAEGKTLEFKRDLSSPDKVIRTLVAFANGAGGRLIIGVEDGSKDVIGVADISKTEERLANLISDCIEPRLVPEIHVLPWRKTQVLAIEVFPSPTRPHFVKSMGFPAGVYIRIGSTNRQADTSAVAELKRVVLGQSFDEQAIPESNCEAIDFTVASQLFAPFRKMTPHMLRSLQLVEDHQGREVPTIGGMLLFGKDRLKYFPDAFLRAGRFDGIDKSRIIDTADITDYPMLAVEKALQFVRRNTRRALEIEAPQHRDVWEFPMVALREAITNAIVHADYSQRGSPLRLAIFDDRIEIDNPGNLPLGMTIDGIQHGVSKLRNRVIGRVFHELNLIEQWGSGIQRMISTCHAAGLPDPKFEELGLGFRVTFSLHFEAKAKPDDLDGAILKLLRKHPGASASNVAMHIKRTRRATITRLNKLATNGVIVAIGTSEQDPRKGYFLKSES